MKKIKIILTTLAFCLTTPLFANCITPSVVDYWALKASTGLNQPNLVQRLLNTYCYNLNTLDFNRMKSDHPIFYVTNPTMLNIFLNKSREPTEYQNAYFKNDILSMLMVLPFTVYQTSTEKEKEEVINLLKKYDPSANINWFNSDFQTLENPEERYKKQAVIDNNRAMISALLPYYSRLYSFPFDLNGNDVLFYALITENYKVFNTLSNNDTNIYRRNKDGFTLLHVAFGKHVYLGDPKEGEENLKKINDILVSRFKPNYAQYLNIQSVSFYNFIEMMKDNNIDLYNKIKEKAKFEIDPVVLKSDMRNKEHYDTTLDYLKDLN